MQLKYSKSGHHPDYFLLALVFMLAVAGLVILTSASSDLGKLKWNDSYYYLKHQLLYGLSFGLVGFFVTFKLNYQLYRKIAFIFLLLNLGALTLVFTSLGLHAGGAARWLQLGPISFQPSELLKLTFVLYLAAWLANTKMNRTNLAEGVLPFLLISGIISGLLVLQPATSTVGVLLLAAAIMYFVSGAKITHLLGIGAAGLIALTLLIWFTPYRRERILAYLNPSKDSEGASFQVTQAKISIGSGKLFGLGYGKSTNKATSLPAPLDDSIFAIAAQELGFVGAGSLIVIFWLFVVRIFLLARKVRDRFGQIVLVGFGSIVALQSLVNMGAISGLLPLTGVPLPFISYGGTALAVFLTMSGVAVNISKYS